LKASLAEKIIMVSLLILSSLHIPLTIQYESQNHFILLFYRHAKGFFVNPFPPHFWTDFKDDGVVLKILASSFAQSFQNEDSI
jgi:hypothetical protein